MIRTLGALTASVVLAASAFGGEGAANAWTHVSENKIGGRFSPGLVWSPKVKRFVLIGGSVGQREEKVARPYQILSFDIAKKEWQNDLPEAGKKWGDLTGKVKIPPFGSYYFLDKDKAGVTRPHHRFLMMFYQYASAPWDGKVYSMVCGRTMTYDPAARLWKNLKPDKGPSPLSRSRGGALYWGALCADPVNKEILLFGGGCFNTERVGPGTWVYSTEKNQWRELKPEVQPPVRVLSPMAYDPGTKKIVLFGGSRLDGAYSDTWTYDCKTRTWKECKPALSPAPRYAHALLYLPKSKKIALLGGSVPTKASASKQLPFETWTYDPAANKWALVQHLEKGYPPMNSVEAAVAAVDSNDRVMIVGRGTKGRNPHSTWICSVNAGGNDAAGAAKYGVKPGTMTYRKEKLDPAWYSQDVPPPDPAKTAAFYKNLAVNKWVSITAPKWPKRGGGGWSSTTIDTDNDQLINMSGGHSAYYGNDLAHFDLKTGRWSISYRPMFALDWNRHLGGPGPIAFNHAPFANHMYHCYVYDPGFKRLVMLNAGTHFYDPVKRVWPFKEKVAAPPKTDRHHSATISTPRGVVTWNPINSKGNALYLLGKDRKWTRLKAKASDVPRPLCDGSAMVYDSKRNRILMITSVGRGTQPQGQVWSVDLKTEQIRKLNPTNMDALKTGRFSREAVYLPKCDLMMVGFLLPAGGKKVMPFYDPEKNKWLVAEIPGSVVISKGTGQSTGFGMVYDAKRDISWGVQCNLAQKARFGGACLCALRIDRKTLKLTELK